MKLSKTYLRAIVAEKRLHNSAVTSIECELSNTLMISRDTVIDWVMAAKVEDEAPSLLNIFYSTKETFEECSFTWTIENLSFIMMGETYGYVITSPSLPSSDKRKCNWEVWFYPCGFYSNHADLIRVTLLLKSTTASNPRIKAKCTLSFYDAKNNKFETLSLDGVMSQGQKLDTWLNREILFKKRTPGDDTLKIKVDINSTIGQTNQLYENTECFSRVKPEHKLVEDLSIMLMEQTFSDVLIVVKGTEIQAHQNIIAARSPVLGAMLKHETKEKNERRIIINDVDPKIMQKLLRFMYTCIIEFTNTDEASKVLVASDKYALEGLKELAEEYLSVNVNTSNALDILNIADLHSVSKLKSRTIDFISENKASFSNVTKYTLNYLKNPQLLVDILARFASD